MFGARPLPRNLEAALRDLGADKPAVRAASVRDLVAHLTSAEDAAAPAVRERAVRALQKALRHDDAAYVRATAATALSDVGAGEALPELLLAVEDDSPLVRQMAIAALGELGDARATERLRRALGDARAEVRFQAVMAFPRVSASREAALDALLHATHDEDALVCHIALRMTDEVRAADPPDPRLVQRARALLGHASPDVRVASALLLASLPPEQRALDGTDGACREILADVGRGALRTSDREDEAAAIELCGELGLDAARPGLEKRAFGGLLGLRRDPLSWHARVALARTGHERACREILRELGDNDRDVCTLAVAAAGRARLAAARPALLALLALRGAAARADPQAVEEALAVLGDAAPTEKSPEPPPPISPPTSSPP
jgi:HEAT repeat protein